MTNVNDAEATAQKNTNELIFKDDSKIFQEKQKMKRAENLLNEFHDIVIDTLGELKPEQIENLPFEGQNIIKKELISRYQFPKADDKFNLEALGIDPSTSYAAYKVKLWKNYKFEFKGGKFVLLPDQDQPEIQKYFYHADSEPKQNAVKLVKDLLKLTEKLKEAGLTDNDREAYLFDMLYGSPIAREKGKLSPIVFNPAGFVKVFKKIK